MNGVMIVPTGLGCSIGGHAGDANPAARLMASVCDWLFVHPNVVNAADINEMTNNMLYVEGSMLDSFLEGEFNLRRTYNNKILVATNKPATPATINAVSASKATLGIDVEILELENPLIMESWFGADGTLCFEYSGCDSLIDAVMPYDFDALAIHTPIDVDDETALKYFRNGGINPWGAVEAKVSKQIARAIRAPVAHAPFEVDYTDREVLELAVKESVSPTVAPEVISYCYLHCVLKGLHKAPRVSFEEADNGFSYADINFMVSPDNCWGNPHVACTDYNIPIIFVKNNQPIVKSQVQIDGPIKVNNYLEAAGLVAAMKAGVSIESVSRPINKPKII